MKYTELRKKISAPVFTLQDLRLRGQKVFSYQLSLWQKHGYILKIKNGLYAFEEELSNIMPEQISPLLYSPSYISLEKALSIYSFIPEMVYTFTAVTPRTTRHFKNKLGSFLYRHIKPALFFGYNEIDKEGHKYLLAEPEKALLDFIYFNLDKIKSSEDISAFRFNRAAVRKAISNSKMRRYLARFNNPKMTKIIRLIIEGK